MYKNTWKDEQAVSPVIATILMVAITVVLAGVLVVYMQQFSNVQNNTHPTAGLVPTPFTNPDADSQTHNGGGWAVTVSTISQATTPWSTVTVLLMSSAVTVYKAVGIKGTTANVYAGNSSAPKANWYGYANPASGVKQYSKYTAGAYAAAANFPNANIDTTYGVQTDLQTVQGFYFIVIDNDGSNTVSAGDIILVFQNYSGGTSQQVGGTGFNIEVSVTAGNIGTAQLA